MSYIKITIIKIDFDQQLANTYGVPDITPCPMHTVGQEIYCTLHDKPNEICNEAWKAIQHYVYALFHDATRPLGAKGWMRKPGVAIATCNDGLRPVTFKIERIQD